MSKRLLAGLIVASTAVLSSAAFAAEPELPYVTPAQKIDSGVADLPAYDGRMTPETWVYMQPAASQDDGLGATPTAELLREPWLYMQPAPKVDSGLGDQPVAARVADRGTQGI